eukprot:CAMPEP_0113522406 /NCGR_PEP_ID=MMETSP0014_2-20120614/45172_1 /TAXON_ID=2857 /ORGANISM="Nitzschia sp." /LENGTH=1004 /DNA_ID=CAMNT_0000420461 /DNA_START=38 /DNA_END=3052 /DNA_ORIENTATION=- /assembly_acc=CAM_ASM_000159
MESTNLDLDSQNGGGTAADIAEKKDDDAVDAAEFSPHRNSSIIVGDEESDLSTTTDGDASFGDGTDFASQLRKHRREVLTHDAAAAAKAEKKKKDDFASTLKKHREHLVESWEESNTTTTATAIAKTDGTGTEEQQQQQDGTNNDNADTDADSKSQLDDPQCNEIDFTVQQEQEEKTEIFGSTEVEVEAIEDNVDDDFGTFETAPVLSTPQAVDDHVDDDFGTFETAPVLSNTSFDEPVGENLVKINGDNDGGTDVNDVFSEQPQINDDILSSNETTNDPISDVSLSFDNPFADEIAQSQNQSQSTDDDDVEEINGKDPIEEDESPTMPDNNKTNAAADNDDDFVWNDASIVATSEPSNQSGLKVDDSLPTTDVLVEKKDVEDSVDQNPSCVDNIQSNDSFDEVAIGSTDAPSSVPLTLNTSVEEDLRSDFVTNGQSQDMTGENLEDDFGDFNSPQLSGPQSNLSPDYTTNGVSTEDVDVIAGSGEGTNASTSAIVDELVPDHQETNIFELTAEGDGKTSTPAETIPLDQHTDRSEDDDEFGDFGQGEFPIEDAPQSNENDTTTAVEGDGFGTIDAAEKASEEEVDDFGSFEEPQPPAAEKVAEEETDDFGSSEDPQPSAAETVGEEVDDFGTFWTAQSPTVGGTEEPVAKDEANDFGNFEAAQPQAVEEDADNFGNFEAAQPSAANAAEEEVDDFGDFAAAEQLESVPIDTTGPSKETTQNAVDDDDWGDFGAADQSPSIPEDAQPPAIKESNLAADDDDFGDFDSADFSKASNIDNEKFGDFNDLPAESSDDIVNIPPIGDIGDNARDFFTKMKMKYSSPDDFIDHDGKDDMSLITNTTVESLISSLQAAPGQKDSAEKVQLHSASPDRAADQGKPRLIIEGDGSGPYGIFMFPLGGLHSPEKKVQAERGRRASSLRLERVPDILPIQLPIGKDMPLNASSPVSSKKKSASRLGRGSLGANMILPNLGTDMLPSAGDDVEQLKASIPDLSFMLQSTLVLPEC